MNGLNMGRQRILRIKAEQKVMKMCLSIGQMFAEAQGGTLEGEGAGSDEDSSVDWPNAEDTAEDGEGADSGANACDVGLIVALQTGALTPESVDV